MMIALLDGSQVDDGTAWEIGYFYAKKSAEQKIIGIRTDFRWAGESRGAVVNAMIECSCDWLVKSREELLETILCFADSLNQSLVHKTTATVFSSMLSR